MWLRPRRLPEVGGCLVVPEDPHKAPSGRGKHFKSVSWNFQRRPRGGYLTTKSKQAGAASCKRVEAEGNDQATALTFRSASPPMLISGTIHPGNATCSSPSHSYKTNSRPRIARSQPDSRRQPSLCSPCPHAWILHRPRYNRARPFWSLRSISIVLLPLGEASQRKTAVAEPDRHEVELRRRDAQKETITGWNIQPRTGAVT